MAGKDGEMFMTSSFNVTPNTTEQHLIAHSDKSVAYNSPGNSLGAAAPGNVFVASSM